MSETMALQEKNYVDVMRPWLKVLPQFTRQSLYNPSLRHYGTGESAHWPIQSNFNVFAALAVLGTSPHLEDEKPAMAREEIIRTALDFLRYGLATHLSGHDVASDGKQWGHHWISVLGLERMAHGVNAIREYLSDDDRMALRRVLISEADWITDNHPVRGCMVNSEGPNVPESNIWNGAVLMRTAAAYPDAPRVKEYLTKATSFMLNGLSHPLDAGCETMFYGKPVRKWHVGFNYTPNWSLDHHGYLNVGYMVICLSNLAMLHFYFKDLGLTPPPELTWHLQEVWAMVKKCTFADGRLLRIGGDTRARYTYCQNYAIPSWMLAQDVLGDSDAAGFEAGWLKIMKQEQDYTGTGGFYGRRLDNIRRINYYYYSRLESDAILCLSYGAYWHRRFQLLAPTTPAVVNMPMSWQDEYHGATFERSGNAVRSFVWHGGQGPTGVIAPADESSMGEWQLNLHGEVLSTQTPALNYGNSDWHELFHGGFVNVGAADWCERDPLGEGEGVYAYARHQIAVAALPDQETMLVLQYATISKEITLDAIKGFGVKVPNDLFNGSKRRYMTADGTCLELAGNPGCADDRHLAADRVCVDGKLAVFALYGADGLTIHRPAKAQIILHKPHGPWLSSLYADEICGKVVLENQRYTPGTVVLDDGFAVAVSGDLKAECDAELSADSTVRQATFTRGNKTWGFAANFGSTTVSVAVPAGAFVLAGSSELAPGGALLWQQSLI